MNQTLSQLEAVGLALAGYTLWVGADTCLKFAGASALPAYEVIALVGAAIAILQLGYAALRRNLQNLWPRQLVRQLVRAGLELANHLCVVVALRHLPLALFYILIFGSPLLTTLLAAVFLGEPLDWKRSLAVLTGFAGVVIAVNPLGANRAGDWTGYLACLVCVSAFSVNMVWSRVLTQTESKESLTFCSGAFMAVTGGVAMLVHAAPVSLRIGSILACTGLFGMIGSLCFFAALRHASAAIVSQYHYSQLLTGALAGYLIWHERPGFSMILGAVLIIGAGLYTASRSYRADALVQGVSI